MGAFGGAFNFLRRGLAAAAPRAGKFWGKAQAGSYFRRPVMAGAGRVFMNRAGAGFAKAGQAARGFGLGIARKPLGGMDAPGLRAGWRMGAKTNLGLRAASDAAETRLRAAAPMVQQRLRAEGRIVRGGLSHAGIAYRSAPGGMGSRLRAGYQGLGSPLRRRMAIGGGVGLAGTGAGIYGTRNNKRR